MARSRTSGSKGKLSDKLLILLLGAGCAILLAYTFLFSERLSVLKISQEDLQTQIDSHLPTTRTVMGMDFGIKKAKLKLDPEAGRIIIEFTPTLGALAINKEIGKMTVSGRLHYLQERGEIYFIMPQVEKLDLAGAPATATSIGEVAVGTLANEYLSRFPVYTLRNEDDREKLLRAELRYIRIEDDAVSVAFRKPF